MFDYKELTGPVRRLLGDMPRRSIEEIQSFQNTSYYITLSEEGYATINRIVIDDEEQDSDAYTIDKNILQFEEEIEAGVSVSIDYSVVDYSDEMLIEYIGDTIKNYIQGLMNKDYGFGDGTTTDSDITFNERSLFVHGSVLNILGINLLTVSGDSIYIKDGDTTINTSVSANGADVSYKTIYAKFMHLLKTIKTNTYQGVVKY